MKHRSKIAADLRSPKYKPRIIKNKKVYNRKNKHKNVDKD